MLQRAGASQGREELLKKERRRKNGSNTRDGCNNIDVISLFQRTGNIAGTEGTKEDEKNGSTRRNESDNNNVSPWSV